MSTKVILFSIIFILSFSVGYGETHGYLSFEYISGYTGDEEPPPAFKNAQAGIILMGGLGKKFFYTAELRAQGTIFAVEQALVSFTPSEYFSLSAGLFLVPFGAYNQSSRPHETLLVRLPLHVEVIYPPRWRDIGIMTEGDFGFLFYSFYLGNGMAEGEYLNASQQFDDNNRNKAKGGRIGIALSRNFAAAVSYYRGRYDEEGERNLNLFSTDITWDIGGLHLFTEYVRANLENPDPFSTGKASGYFIQASIIMGNLQPVVSYQRLEYEDPFHGEGFVDTFNPGIGIVQDKVRWTVGFVFFPLPSLLIKIEYDYNQDKILDIKNNTFSAQAALSF